MSFGGVNTFQQYSTDFGLGHNGVKISFNYFDGFPEPSLLNSLASNDLKLIFKSLLKRDETTKEKALNDLLRLVEGYSENEELFDSDIFFLCWSQVYPKLLVSESKAIRTSSHLVTSKLVKLLNKKISKFLKDVIPLLLLGICDTDSSVSKACNTFLNDIFDNNSSKVSVLWSVFQEDILKVADELIVKENKDTISDERFVGKEDSLLRFNRLISSAVQLLTTLVNSGNLDVEKYGKTVHEILVSEDLWNLMSFKSIHFLKSYEATLKLQKSLYKNDLLKTQKDVLKISTKRLLKSLSQVDSRNILKVAHLTGPIVDNLTMLDHYKEGRIWSFDKSAKERFLHFVTLASKNASPGFFNSLYAFYEETSTGKLLEDDDWLVLWRKTNKAFIDKPFLGRYGAELLGEFWVNYRKFIDYSSIPDVEQMAKEDALDLLRSDKQPSKLPSLRKALTDFLDPEFLAESIKKLVVEEDEQSGPLLDNLVLLLCIGHEKEAALHDVAGAMLEVIAAHQENFGLKERKILQTYITFVQSGITCLSDEISQFAYEIPTWVDENNYENLSLFIVEYSKSVTAQDDKNFVTVMEDFLTAAVSADIPKQQIIKNLNMLDSSISSVVLSSPMVEEFVQHYVNTYDYDDNGELFNGGLIKENNVVELYHKSVESNNIDSFLSHLPSLSTCALETLLVKSSFLSVQLFSVSSKDTGKIYHLLKPLLEGNQKIVQSLANAIISHSKTNWRGMKDSLLLEIAEEVVALSEHDLHVFMPSNLETEFSSVVPFIDHRLALVGSLKLNTFLFDLSSDELNMPKIRQLINYASFLDALVRRTSMRLDYKVCVFLTMVSELLEDYNCLAEEPQEEIHGFQNTLFEENWTDFSFEEAIDFACQRGLDDKVTGDALTLVVPASPSITVTYYQLRIFHKIMQNKVDSVSLATFTRKFPIIEKFVVSAIRNKENDCHGYLLSGTILSAAEKFSDLDLYAKLRNTLASECIGVKENELLNKTYKNIILLTDLLGSHPWSDLSLPIALQRLNMMISSLSQWLESDLAYEPGFAKVRLAVLRLCAHLARNPAIVKASDSLRELSMKVLSDSLSMCLLDDTEYLLELRLYCLLLHEVLHRGSEDHFSEIRSEESHNDLVDLGLVDFAAEKNNQISSVFYRTLFKLLSAYPAKQAVKFYPNFLSAFLSSEGCENVNHTRMLFGELERLVIERQKDAFLEFEFEKQKRDDETSDVQKSEAVTQEMSIDDKLQLPEVLIDKLCSEIPEDYLESENEYAFLKYLWYWDLTFCFFRDASYDLRQKFIDQLKSKDLITTFFYFISDQIDLQETKFWSDAGSAAILNYSIQCNDFSPYREDLFSECKKLLGHSLYNLFLNVGSLTSNWWLNIKDRTLQTKIEKFVSTFISPILISKELDDVAEKTNKLESNDSALTIKINKVTNEVKASYLIDEQKLELSFKLPANYPLTNVQVMGVSRIGISEQKWKQWIMSTQRVITGMNGSVVDSLDLFSKNVNLQFSGFEECAICYSILHIVDRKLPTKTCPTCNNKFHGACLYKWFRSSGNNTCPLCRSEIPFRR